MLFFWTKTNEETWKKFVDAIVEKEFDVAHMEGEYLGSCHVGDLCFDVRAWSPDESWCGWGFELFCGGVDTGYNYSEDGYPWDEAGYGDFPDRCLHYDLSVFQKRAEEVFEKFIVEQNKEYKEADLEAKAREPLHIW